MMEHISKVYDELAIDAKGHLKAHHWLTLFNKFCYSRNLEGFVIRKIFNGEVANLPFNLLFRRTVLHHMRSLSLILIEKASVSEVEEPFCDCSKNSVSYGTTTLQYLVNNWMSDIGERATTYELIECLLAKSPALLHMGGLMDGSTPFEMAIGFLAYDLIPMLIKTAPDLVNTKLKTKGVYPIYHAIYKCKSDSSEATRTAQTLVECGADMTLAGHDDRIPYHYALVVSPAAKNLLEYLKSATPAELVARVEKQVEEEREKNPPPKPKSYHDFLGKNGLSVVHTACINGNISEVKQYLTDGTDLSVKTSDGESCYSLALKTIEFLKAYE